MLGPHVVNTPSGTAEAVARSKIVLYLDPGGPVPMAPITIGRIHSISEDDGDLLRDPVGLGRRHAEQLAVHAAATGIELMTGLNERNPVTADMATAVCQYEIARLTTLHALGLYGVVLNFGRGHPNELSDGTIDWAPFAPLVAATKPGDFWALHEYWNWQGPLHPDSLYHLCWRFKRCPFDIPIVITEMGEDWSGTEGDGFLGTHAPGKPHPTTVAEDVQHTKEYLELVRQDKRFYGAVKYTFGHNPPWQTWDWQPWWLEYAPLMAMEKPPVSTPDIVIDDISASLPHGTTSYGKRALTQITKLVIHHTVTPTTTTPQAIANYHVNSNGWPGIGYHFIIGATGNIYQTNSLETVSYHVGDDNTTSIGLALLGDFTNTVPTTEQLQATADLIKHLRGILGWNVPVVGHNDLMQTQCPGNQWPTYKVTLFGLLGETTGGTEMKLSDYPVPDGNNAFGWHWLPQLADSRPYAETKAQIERMWRGGARWIKLITAPGGDIGWQRGSDKLGACEMTFCIAIDMGMGVVVRLYTSAHPPYWTDAVEKNLKHLMELAGGRPFYVEPANEIDAEYGSQITRAEAEAICRAIADFIDGCWRIGNGEIIPVFPSFGYGGPGYNWFQVMHDVSKGDRLDRCGVAVHNYASCHRLYEPYDPDYIAGTPVTQAEFDVMPWRWKDRTVAQVNAKRADNARKRALLKTDDDLMAAYASGWFTWKWAVKQLDALGHTETPLLLTETGTRVGEMVEWEPRIDPLLHLQRMRAMIANARAQRRIISTHFWHWIGKWFTQIDPVWEDQAVISPIWDRRWNTTMSDGEYAQIRTGTQLPIVDSLEEDPIPEGRGTSEDPTEPPDEEEPPVSTIPVAQPTEWLLPEWCKTTLQEPALMPNEEYWHLTRIALPLDDWATAIIIRVYDENGNRLVENSGVQVFYRNTGNGEIGVLPWKQAPDPQDKPMSKNDTYEIWITDTLGRKSDLIGNLHTRYPEATHLFHVGEELDIYLRRKAGVVVPPVEPPDDDPDPVVDPNLPWAEWDEEGFRDYVSKIGNETVPIPYNPTSGLARHGRELVMGLPMTRESGGKKDPDPTLPRDYKRRFRWIRFAMGYLVSPVGVWSEVLVVRW